MPDSSWFHTSPVPVLSQLGATMGQGVTPTYNGVDMTAYLENVRKQNQDNADREYGLRKQQLDHEYQTARLTAKTAQERNAIDQQYQQANIKLAQDRLAEEHRQFDQTFGENQRQYNTTTGYNLMKTLADLRGPANYFQASNYARNIGGNPNTAGFLDALQNGARLSGFGAQAGLPDAETGATLLNKLGAQGQTRPGADGSGGGYGNDNNYMAQIGNIAAKGAGQLAPGALENLTQTERDLFGSGLDNLGIDKNTFLDQYARSRFGQGFGSSRAA